MDIESMPGDVKAARFVELYGPYARDVFRFALYLSGDTALAQDNSSFGVFVLLPIYPFWAIGRKLCQFRMLDELDRPQPLFHDSNGRNEM